MNLSQMIKLVDIYTDDVNQAVDVVPLLNAGQNRMATETRCKFPQLEFSSSLEGTFVFDEVYHETPVLYASAMLKAKDSAVREKESYMVQFEAGVKNFVENFDPPMQYRQDANIQQFTATEGQDTFAITKRDYSPVYSGLSVYKNGVVAAFVKGDEGTFILQTPAIVGDAVTAEWETNSDFLYKPAFDPGW